MMFIDQLGAGYDLCDASNTINTTTFIYPALVWKFAIAGQRQSYKTVFLNLFLLNAPQISYPSPP